MRNTMQKVLTRSGFATAIALFLIFISLSPANAKSQRSTIPETSYHYALGSSQSNYGPSVEIACYNPALGGVSDHFVVYTGTDDQINIYDVSVPVNYTTGIYTYSTPAIACFNGALYIAWQTQSNNIDVGYFYDFNADSGNADLNNVTTISGQTTDEGPALTVGGTSWSTLYVGWIGTGSTHNLNIEQSTNGTSWTNKVTFSDYTPDYAGLTLYGDNYISTHPVYASWVSCCSTPTINLAQYNGTSTWASKHTFTSDWSPWAPGMEAYNGKIYFIWKGGTSQSAVSNVYTGCWNSSAWHGSVEQSDVTTQSIGMDGNSTNLVTAFTGTDSYVYYTWDYYSYPSGC